MDLRLHRWRWQVNALLLAAASAAISRASEPTDGLTCDDNRGVMCSTSQAVLRLDASPQQRGPIIRVGPGGDEYRLVDPHVQQVSSTQLALAYQLAPRGGPSVSIRRDITVRRQADGIGLVETFAIQPSQPWAADIEIERPLSVRPGGTYGTTYLRNAAHPAVAQWYLDYCDALLKTYGDEFDGLVWDETFHAALGQIASEPAPAYCDRAYLALVKALAQRVHAFDPQKVFLTSDCIGIPGMENVPGYAMVAHGTWQDSWCHPAAWSFGLFPNWRNVLWSCNWSPISNFHYTRFGVEEFGTPVAISNGWGDDCGASEWQPTQRERILALFTQRCAHSSRVRYLTTDPAGLLARGPHVAAPGDPLPEPDPTLTNWALAAHGSTATASSEMAPGWPAAGAIDGVRDDTGWGGGHGWASAPAAALPQWLEVTFPQPQRLSRLVVITYQQDGTAETAGKWGIQDYELQIWDVDLNAWKTVVTEHQGRAVKTRVHALPQPFETSKIRLLVQRVAPLDGPARLLQLEAWGPATETP